MWVGNKWEAFHTGWVNILFSPRQGMGVTGGILIWQFQISSSAGKESACNAGDPVSIPGLRRSSGEGNNNPLQYSCLETPVDRGAWQAIVQGVTQVGHEFGWILGVGYGQGGLACCNSWGCRVRHDWATELTWLCTFVPLAVTFGLTFNDRSSFTMSSLSYT